MAGLEIGFYSSAPIGPWQLLPGIIAPAARAHETPIMRVNSMWVKRDDEFFIGGSSGGKVRTCAAIAARAIIEGKRTLVTAGHRYSPQCNIVATVAAASGLQAVCFTAAGPQTPELEAAERAGALVMRMRPGYSSVIAARAREYADADPTTALVPFGMEDEAAIWETATQVRGIPSLDPPPRRIVVAAGSGMSALGIAAGLDAAGLDIPIIAVIVGADPIPRWNRFAGNSWRERIFPIPAAAPYHVGIPDAWIGPAHLDPHYEAKVLPFVEPDDLVWIVGRREADSITTDPKELHP